MHSSALLDAAVRSQSTTGEQEVKVSPSSVKSKKPMSITAKFKSPAPISRAKKLSLDKAPAEKGVILLQTSFHFSVFLFALSGYDIDIVPEITYYVSSGTLNPTHSLTIFVDTMILASFPF